MMASLYPRPLDVDETIELADRVREMAGLFEARNYSSALVLAESVLAGAPDHAQARRAMRAPPPVEFRSALGRAWRSALSLLVGASWCMQQSFGTVQEAAKAELHLSDNQLGLLQGLAVSAVAALLVVGLVHSAVTWAIYVLATLRARVGSCPLPRPA